MHQRRTRIQKRISARHRWRVNAPPAVERASCREKWLSRQFRESSSPQAKKWLLNSGGRFTFGNWKVFVLRVCVALFYLFQQIGLAFAFVVGCYNDQTLGFVVRTHTTLDLGAEITAYSDFTARNMHTQKWAAWHRRRIKCLSK